MVQGKYGVHKLLTYSMDRPVQFRCCCFFQPLARNEGGVALTEGICLGLASWASVISPPLIQ